MGNQSSTLVVESKDNRNFIKKQIEGLNDDGILNLIEKYTSSNNLNLALQYFDLCKSKFKFYEVGIYYLKMGNDKLALSNLLKFNKIDKYKNQWKIANISRECVRGNKLTNARLNIARCYYRAGDFNEAIVWYNKALMRFCIKHLYSSSNKRLCDGCTGTDNIEYDYFIYHEMAKIHVLLENIGLALFNHTLAFSKVKYSTNPTTNRSDCLSSIYAFINSHKIDENLLMCYIDKVYSTDCQDNKKLICDMFMKNVNDVKINSLDSLKFH